MEILRITKVIKTGTSLCVVIPKDILDSMSLRRGDQVAFGIYDKDTIAIRRISMEDLRNLKPNDIH